MFFRHLLLLGLLNIYTLANGRVNTIIDAYSMSVSGATATSLGIYSLSENQAGLAFSRETMIAINYSNRYLLNELATQSLCYIMPVGKATAGLSLLYFGGKALNESCYSLAYGRQLYRWLVAGVKMNYHYLGIEAIDGHTSAITGEIGIQVFPINGLNVGLHIKNPTKSQYITLNNEELYSGLKVGISYSEPGLYIISTQFDSDNFEQSNLILAGEYWVFKAFIIRGGVKVKRNPSWSFGTGFKHNQFQFDIGFEHHTILGLSGSISLIFNVKNHEN